MLDHWLPAVSLILTILLMAWQTHALVRQTKLQTQVALASAADTPITMVQAAMLALLERPTFVRYLYEDARPAEDDAAEARVLVELFADAVNFGCEVREHLPIAMRTMAGFPDYGRFLLAHSPMMDDMVRNNPMWWPQLEVLRDENPDRAALPAAAGDPATQSVAS